MRRVLPLIAAVAAVQLWFAHRYYGFLTGDDLEVIAEAFRRALGFRYSPWDIRNLFVPDLIVAPAVWLPHVLGVHDTRALIELASVPFVIVSAATIWLVYRLALQWTEDERVALVASLLFALHWIPLDFGSTVYPRTIATACVVGAALIVQRRPALAGLLMGLAFADRFSEIVFIVPLMAIAQRRVRFAAGVVAGVAITTGVYDWITWGSPFSSVLHFARLTLVAPDFASRVKYQGPLWYLANLPRWCAITLLPLLFVARKRVPWLFLVVPLIALSVVRHKELRYLQALIPFLAIGAAIGFITLWQRWPKTAAALLVVSLAWNLYGVRELGHKSMPAVDAARALAADPHVHNLVVSQLWAFGDRVYLGDRLGLREAGTPPRDLERALPGADVAALYETDLDPPVVEVLQRNGFVRGATFRDGRAKAVTIFSRSVSGTSDPARR